MHEAITPIKTRARICMSLLKNHLSQQSPYLKPPPRNLLPVADPCEFRLKGAPHQAARPAALPPGRCGGPRQNDGRWQAAFNRAAEYACFLSRSRAGSGKNKATISHRNRHRHNAGTSTVQTRHQHGQPNTTPHKCDKACPSIQCFSRYPYSGLLNQSMAPRPRACSCCMARPQPSPSPESIKPCP